MHVWLDRGRNTEQTEQILERGGKRTTQDASIRNEAVVLKRLWKKDCDQPSSWTHTMSKSDGDQRGIACDGRVGQKGNLDWIGSSEGCKMVGGELSTDNIWEVGPF